MKEDSRCLLQDRAIMSWVGWKQVLEGSSFTAQRRGGTRAQGAAGRGASRGHSEGGTSQDRASARDRRGLQQGTGEAPISKGAGQWVEEAVIWGRTLKGWE